MPKHSITLDLLKEIQVIPEEVEVRVGEANSQTIEATLTEKGLPYKVPEGEWTASVTLLTAAKNTKTQPAQVSEDRGTLTVTLADEMLTDEGTCKLAYFKLCGPDAEILTTEGFILRVQGSTITAENGQSWDQEIADLKQTFALEIQKIQEDEKTRIENELIRIAQEAAREEAERLRRQAESVRDTAEGERKSAEDTRAEHETQREADEATRKQQETARETAEQKRESAETERGEAEDARSDAETLRAAAEKVRETQETTRETNEEARKKAEANRATEEGKRAVAEAERVEAEEKRAADFTASQDANANAFASSEQSRQETFEAAEKTRQEDEDARVAAESARDEAEQLRAQAEKARAKAEQDRADAEDARDAAEQLRAAAEQARAEAQTDRDERQAANDAAQAKNNADQQANNKAALGLTVRILKDGEYDPATRVPTIEGDFTNVFCVPTADAEAAIAEVKAAEKALKLAADSVGEEPSFDGEVAPVVKTAQERLASAYAAVATNHYMEWLWLLDDAGEGYWEPFGTSEAVLPEGVTTDEIDRMFAGETVSNQHIGDAAGLSYLVSKTTGAIDAQATTQAATDAAQDTSITAAQAAADAASKAADAAKSAAASDLADAVATQATKDEAQDTAIAAAKKAGDDAASALDAYKKAQKETDDAQDTAIAAAKQAGADAKAAIGPAITAEDTAIKAWVTDEAKAHAAETADVATKLGTGDVGSTVNPIFLLGGIATAISKVAAAATADTAANATTAAKLGSETVGDAKTGIYLDGGTPKATTGVDAPTMEEFNALKSKIEALEQTVSACPIPVGAGLICNTSFRPSSEWPGTQWEGIRHTFGYYERTISVRTA